MTTPILFYDGHCPFCHFWVKFLLKYDKKKHFYFAPLSGENAKLFFKQKGIEVPESIVLVDEKQYYLASEAIFCIARKLGGVFKMILVFKILPRQLTDHLYYFIAKNRFILGGPYDCCFLPEREHKNKFLD
jgi:predicted DCC family thiol-disulfide oxidoreductase YuxK